jgi:hypothetical protein
LEGAALCVSQVLATVSAEITVYFMGVVPVRLIDVNVVPTNVLTKSISNFFSGVMIDSSADS